MPANLTPQYKKAEEEYRRAHTPEEELRCLELMLREDVLVQLIDTPPITADFLDPNILGITRGSDLALLMFDAGADDGIDALQAVLDRLNATKTRLAKQSYLDEEDVGLSFTQTF